jgi:GMP synthase-like glutamine amidotransferase
MAVLILKNIVTEGPGTIERFLSDNNVGFTVVELGEGEKPPALDAFGSLVVMGGPMAIYEADKHSFLKEGFKMIEAALKSGMRVLGVCLGAQALAHVLGARVYKGDATEVGWLDVELTEEGLQDPVMRSLASDGKVLKVFQWHGDTFDIPSGARKLARSEAFENQAFGYGDGIYGLQFHIEATPEMIARWFQGEPGEAEVLEDTKRYYGSLDEKAKEFYNVFFDIHIVRVGVGLN